tara:strand:+ start:199 stop:1494 length:1296 start_codon:yes stop_codon:yes gene_type:complete
LKPISKNKKVLIITYYWPPSGGAGVQRWLKFSKYLPEFGWDPVVFTPENPDVPVEDITLLGEVSSLVQVLKIPIFEPSRVISLFGRKMSTSRMGAATKSSNKTSIIKGFISWVRGNIFIPDARVTWVKPAVKFVNKWINENHIDAIITTGPPHSMHLIGLGVKKTYPQLKWISDFRDPWSDMDYLDDFKMGKRAKRKLIGMEKKVVEYSDKITITSPSIVKTLLDDGNIKKAILIPNGWDSLDFKDVKAPENKSTVFKIGHFGSLYGSRNVPGLWRAVKRWNQLEGLKIEIYLVGSVGEEIKLELKNDQHVKFTPSLSHKKAVIEMVSCDALLLVQNATDAARKCTPGKVFEYIACEKPLLSICNSPSDLATQLRNWGLPFCDHEDEDAAYEMLKKITQSDAPIKVDPSPYERKALTKKLVDELDTLTKHS